MYIYLEGKDCMLFSNMKVLSECTGVNYNKLNNEFSRNKKENVQIGSATIYKRNLVKSKISLSWQK